MSSFLAAAALALSFTVLPGGPPRVEKLEPANGAKDVDARKVTKLVVTFDRSMMTDGWSLCGGGETHPVWKGKPKWDSTKKLVMEVELEPDHEYVIGLNCPSATNFRGADGTALEPVTWTFRTAPEKGAKAGKAKPSGPPKVVSLEPESGAADLDPKAVKQLVVTFDRPMSQTGWSFCGGESEVPKIIGKPRWETPQKLVVHVVLEPDHEYRMSLNCPAATKFQGADGTKLEPVPWSFTTAEASPADPAKQEAENRAALDALAKLLAESYSYYDLRSIGWGALFREHEPRILGAKSSKEWTRAVAGMLGVTQDIHMYLKVDGQIHGTGKRAVDPLYREALLTNYLMVKPVGAKARRGRTDDGIGYLMIPEWTDSGEINAIEEALPALKDCQALVVDVRPNSGGDELLARRIAAWFVEGSRVYAKNRYRTGPGPDGFGPVYDRAIEGNTEAENRLTMPVVVLTSRYVMSSNESFVLMMRQAPDCTVVGQRTYGSSGNPKPHELPNGVTIVVPSWQDLRLDGTCFEGEGIAADIEVNVSSDELKEKDPILERGLAVLREKIAAGLGSPK
ncbi:MAG: S41 family peptidase [Planctomycetota bacterium]